MPYQMTSGKWRAKKMICGKIKTKVFNKKKDALRWESQQTAEEWAAEEAQPPTSTICWLDFCNAYLDYVSERQSQKTVTEKKLAFRRSLQIIPKDTSTDAISIPQAEEILRKVGRESSGYAANKTRKNLAAAWQWGIKFYGLPLQNPFHAASKLPADATPRYVPPESDFWKVYDAAEDERDKTLLLFLLHTGARIQEAFRLVWSDVDFERRQVRLGTRKTATGGMEFAWIPMTDELSTALLTHKRNSASLNVFVASRTGKKLTHLQHFMPRLCAKAKVVPFGFHAIRHLTATILAHAGLDLPSIQAILRHHNPTTTARYIKSLGVSNDKVNEIFSHKNRGAKIISKTVSKAAE